MKRYVIKLMTLGGLVLPGILPVSCERGLLRELTPFLIDGSNGLVTDLISAAAPLVLP